VLVVVEVSVSQISVLVALLLSHVPRSVGANKTPFHVPHEAWITTPLTLISSLLLEVSVPRICKVQVVVNVIPVEVAHHKVTDHVAITVPVIDHAPSVLGVLNEDIEESVHVYAQFFP